MNEAIAGLRRLLSDPIAQVFATYVIGAVGWLLVRLLRLGAAASLRHDQEMLWRVETLASQPIKLVALAVHAAAYLTITFTGLCASAGISFVLVAGQPAPHHLEYRILAVLLAAFGILSTGWALRLLNDLQSYIEAVVAPEDAINRLRRRVALVTGAPAN
jgi:hypothetical protein